MSESRIEFNVDGATEQKITIVDSTPKVMLGEDACHTIPFLLGFFIGIVMPVVFLVVASKLGVETLAVKSPICANIAHYNPVVVLLYFAAVVLVILLLYGVHCWYCSINLKTKYAYEKALIDSRVGLAHKVLDVAMSKSQDKSEKKESLDITLRVGHVDSVKDRNKDDGIDPDGGESPTRGDAPPPQSPVLGDSAFSFGTPNTSSVAGR